MTSHGIALIVALTIGGVVLFLLSILGWWNRTQPGVFWFTLHAFLVGCWTFLGLGAVVADQSGQTIFLSLLANGLGTAVAVTWFLFIIGYLGHSVPMSRQQLSLLAATVSSLDFLFYALSYETELVVTGFETSNWADLQVATFEPTLLGLPSLLLGFGLFIGGLALVVRAIAVEDDLHAAHGIVIFAATILPVLVALLIVAEAFPNGLPVIPLAAVVSSILYVLAFWQYDLFTLTPATERIGIEQAFDDLGAGAIVTNDTGTILQVNSLAEEIVEQNSTTLVGRDIETVLSEFDVTRASLPTTYKTNGIIYRISESQVTNDDGSLIGHSVLFVDVTDRKERYRQRLSVALDAADAGVWEWDLTSGEIVWDSSMEQLVGLEPGSFDGSYEQFRAQIHPADRDGFDEVVGQASSHDEEIAHECRLQSDETDRWIAIRARPVQRDGTRQLIGVSIDITERKEREQTFEKLYRGSRQILGESSTQGVCEQTIDVVQSVLDLSAVGIHLYDRKTEALEPVAVSEQVRADLAGELPRYTNRETAIWDAYEEGTTVRINDTETFDGTLPDSETPTRSAVILSIGTHGVLITSAVEPRAFGDEDVEFLQLLAQLVEIVLDRTVNEQGLTAVQRTVRDILAVETHQEMATTVLEAIPDALDLPIAGIWKYQAATQQLEPLGVTEQASELIGEPPTYSQGGSIASQTFESGTTTIVSDMSNHPEVYNPDTQLNGEIIVPIGEFGVLSAGSTYRDSFTQLDAEILEILAANLEIVSQIIEQRQDINLLDQVIARILRHNVRNKLTPIMGYANQIIQNPDKPARPYAEEILESGQELEKISEHAREMRRIVQSRSKMQELSLEDHVRSVVNTIEQNFPDGDLVVDIGETPTVTAHPEIGTAIRHLIRNGFEHNTSETPTVEVTVTDTARGPTVEITDNGPGLDRRELDILEEHRESALEHGSGAGLWIVDRVLEYSEAIVEFETKNGTSVTITFPQQ